MRACVRVRVRVRACVFDKFLGGGGNEIFHVVRVAMVPMCKAVIFFFSFLNIHCVCVFFNLTGISLEAPFFIYLFISLVLAAEPADGRAPAGWTRKPR